jgi:hypothetical protein
MNRTHLPPQQGLGYRDPVPVRPDAQLRPGTIDRYIRLMMRLPATAVLVITYSWSFAPFERWLHRLSPGGAEILDLRGRSLSPAGLAKFSSARPRCGVRSATAVVLFRLHAEAVTGAHAPRHRLPDVLNRRLARPLLAGQPEGEEDPASRRRPWTRISFLCGLALSG